LNATRRNVLKLGLIGGISATISRLPTAQATEVHAGAGDGSWLAPDGTARYRWDAIRKVTGEKVFARDFRARDLPGWPRQQAHAFFIKATRADRSFEGLDLSLLGDDLQPDRLLFHEDLERDGIRVPQPADLGFQFYGAYFLVPRGVTAPILGHPVALLIYHDFARFEAAKRKARFMTELVRYGAEKPPQLPPNYGCARYVRIEGATPGGPPVYSAMQDSVIWGGFNGNEPTWPPESPTGIFVPHRVAQRYRGGSDRDPLL
jgi:hypothetical protein